MNIDYFQNSKCFILIIMHKLVNKIFITYRISYVIIFITYRISYVNFLLEADYVIKF